MENLEFFEFTIRAQALAEDILDTVKKNYPDAPQQILVAAFTRICVHINYQQGGSLCQALPNKKSLKRDFLQEVNFLWDRCEKSLELKRGH